MAFDHANSPWGEWLRQVFAARPPNVKVIGQSVQDTLQAGIQVADVSHLAPPVDWIVAGGWEAETAVPATYIRLEVIAYRAMWITHLEILQPAVAYAYMWTQASPTLAGHYLPPSVFSGVPQNKMVVAGTAVAEPDVHCLTVGRFNYHKMAAFLPLYIPKGKVFVVQNYSVNVQMDIAVMWREIPETR